MLLNKIALFLIGTEYGIFVLIIYGEQKTKARLRYYLLNGQLFCSYQWHKLLEFLTYPFPIIYVNRNRSVFRHKFHTQKSWTLVILMISYTLFILHCFTSFVNKIQDMFVVYGSFSEYPNPILWRPAVGNIGDLSSWITLELAFCFFNFLLVDRLISVVSFQNILGYLRLVLGYLVVHYILGLGTPS